jgi:GNAT superfamily N-acetyltransferase
MIEPTISRLRGTHILDEFDCGDPAVNGFLRDAEIYEEKLFSRIYVVTSEDTVIGYYALASGSIHGTIEGKKTRWPSLLLGQLGVDLKYQGQGIGSILIDHVKAKARSISDEIGCRILFLHTYNSSLVEDFYIDHHGFSLLEVRDLPQGTRYTLYIDISRL